MIKGKTGKEPEGKYEQRKIPLYKSYFARMIFIMLVFFIMVISISFLYLYVGMKKLPEKKDGYGKAANLQSACAKYRYLRK